MRHIPSGAQACLSRFEFGIQELNLYCKIDKCKTCSLCCCAILMALGSNRSICTQYSYLELLYTLFLVMSIRPDVISLLYVYLPGIKNQQMTTTQEVVQRRSVLHEYADLWIFDPLKHSRFCVTTFEYMTCYVSCCCCYDEGVMKEWINLSILCVIVAGFLLFVVEATPNSVVQCVIVLLQLY